MRRIINFIFVLLSLTLALALFGCEPDKSDNEYKVMVSLGAGASIDGANPVTVKHGESASFKVKFARGYCYAGCEGGSYDQNTATITVDNVTDRVNVNLYTAEYPYDPDETFVYLFRADSLLDTTDTRPGSAIPAARLITVSAGDTTRKFVGWSLGTRSTDPEDMISTDRVFTFRVSPELSEDGTIEIYPNYTSVNRIVYNLNGGSIDPATVNMRGNAHTTVTSSTDTVTVAFSDEYLEFMECGSSFYDDGSFFKEGAILLEYNTRPDGSGESYSLGSKVPLVHGGEETVLYCIWATDSKHSAFTYTERSMSNPATKAAYAPDWVTDGIVITDYLGNDTRVVIPDEIDGKTVIGIAAGAFRDLDMTTLVMGRHIQLIEDGAFENCPALTTVYFPDSIYHVTNAAFDAATTAAIKHLYVNATMAPRYGGADTGGLAVKLSRLLAPTDLPRIIIIAGSSTYQGLGTEYLEALLDGEYRVINFGTTRTTHGLMYLEAMGHYATSRDTVIYAPENSSYMFGERELYYKTLRDLEGMVNIYRYVDISGYTNVLGAFAELNGYRYAMAPLTYEGVCEKSRESELALGRGIINKYGDYQKADRTGIAAKYYDSYMLTMNEYVKSKNEGAWNDVGNQQANSNYLDPNNITWCKITDPYYRDTVNRAVTAAKAGGARVYFSFCPVEGDKLVAGANTVGWLGAYDALIDSTYVFDGRVGASADYIFASEYFYDNAFHLNDYGRTYRTYQLYRDLCAIFGDSPRAMNAEGTDFDGCLFDGGTGDAPKYPWTPEN